MDRKEIVDYLAKKVFNGELRDYHFNIMLKNKQIYFLDDYSRLVDFYKITPEDAFVYIDFDNFNGYDSHIEGVAYLFPLIEGVSIYVIVRSYLSKLGFYNPNYYVYPATGLKYYAAVRLFSDRLVIELTDIDIMATNTGLRKIIVDVLGKGVRTQKELSGDQIREIVDKLRHQKLFVGYDLDEVHEIIKDYYTNHNTSLIKDVLAIANAYNRIFEPYRVVYDTATRQQVLM